MIHKLTIQECEDYFKIQFNTFLASRHIYYSEREKQILDNALLFNKIYIIFTDLYYFK